MKRKLFQFLFIFFFMVIYTFANAAVEPTPVRVVSGTVTSQMIGQLNNIYERQADGSHKTQLVTSAGVLFDMNEGATTSSTLRASSNQGLPNTIVNAWPMMITDGTDSRIVTPVKDNQHFSSSDFGIGFYGLDTESPRKWRPIKTDSEGHQYHHVLAANNDLITDTASGTKRGLDVAVITSVLPTGAATSSLQSTINSSVVSNTVAVTSGANGIITAVSTNTTQTVSGHNTIIGWLNSIWTRLGDKSQFTKVTGGDGLYTATVDSLNRLSVNANIQFPEAVYVISNLLNGSSKAMNVNGATTPVTFQYLASGTTYYLESVSFFLADNAAFDSGGFGALAALTNGVVIEYQSKGVLYTLTNLQTNGDLLTTMGDATFGSIQSGLLGTDAYITGTSRIQQRIALDPAFGDFIRARVRDNITGLTTFNIRVKVWRVN